MSLSAEQKLEIHELLSKSAYAYDERDEDMLESCFAADASLSMRIADGDLIGPFEGREAIMGLMRGSMEEQTDVRRHVVSNMFFTATGDRPAVVSNLSLFATENGEIQLLSAGLYRDEVQHDGQGWVIVRRHIDLDKPY